jgi:hypothetical protein
MILFGCQDVGPAKYLRELISSSTYDACCTSGSLSRPYFREFEFTELESIQNIEELKLVVVGTSLGDPEESLDKRILEEARKLKVPSVAVVEHWSWYRKRFETSNGLLLPDYIVVNDKFAQKEAVSEGLPSSRLKPLGNPFLERLSLGNPDTRKIGAESKKKLGLPPKKRIVLFVSEELKSTFKVGTEDYLGYDEYQVLNEIKSALLPRDHLVIKSHPAEDSTKYASFLDDRTSHLDSCSVEELRCIADVVVGMASMLLLELAVFRNDVISFRPNARKVFIGELLKATCPVKNADQLSQAMRDGVKSESRFSKRFSGSKNRITDFLTEISK